MPQPPNPPKGLAELEEVLGRYAARGQLDFDLPSDQIPQAISQVARHLYHGHAEGPLAAGSEYLDPSQWRQFARLGDRFDDPGIEEGGSVFGMDPRSHARYLRKGEIGQGWTDDDVKANGGRANFELSPGDQHAHQHLRDREYLEAMLDKDSQPLGGWVSDFDDARSEDELLEGSAHHNVNRNIDEALRYYGRSRDAKFSHGGNGFDPWRESNFRRYATGTETLKAMENPEFAAGAVLGPMSAIGQFTSKQAAEHPEEKDWTPIRKTPLVGPALGATGDFAVNLSRSLLDGSAGQEFSDAWTHSTRGKDINNISPIIPQSTQPGWKDTPKNRAAGLSESAGVHSAARGMDQDDYWRAETGQVPSYAGSIAGEALYEAPFDPLTIATMGAGSAVGLARGAVKGFGRGALKRSLLHGVNEVAKETFQEGATSLPLTAGIHASIGGARPGWDQMFKPGIENRPDLQENPSYIKDDAEFDGKMKSYDADQRAAADMERRHAETRKQIQAMGKSKKTEPVIKPGSVPMGF